MFLIIKGEKKVLKQENILRYGAVLTFKLILKALIDAFNHLFVNKYLQNACKIIFRRIKMALVALVDQKLEKYHKIFVSPIERHYKKFAG